MAIITTTQYKTFAGIGDASQDTILDVVIPAVQDRLERSCGRLFDTGSRSEIFDGDGSAGIILKHVPVTAMTSVVLTADDGTTTTYSSATSPTFAETFRYDSVTGRLQWIGAETGRLVTDEWGSLIAETWGTSPRFRRKFQNVTVSYTGGYTSMPEDLQLLMYELVGAAMQRRGSGTGQDPTLLSESVGSYTYTLRAIDEAIKAYADAIRPWKRGMELVA